MIMIQRPDPAGHRRRKEALYDASRRAVGGSARPHTAIGTAPQKTSPKFHIADQIKPPPEPHRQHPAWPQAVSSASPNRPLFLRSLWYNCFICSRTAASQLQLARPTTNSRRHPRRPLTTEPHLGSMEGATGANNSAAHSRGDGNRGRGRGRGGQRGRGQGEGGRGGRGRGRGGGNRQAPTIGPANDADKSTQPGTLPAFKVKPEEQDQEQDDDEEVCFICANPIEHLSVAPCNHSTCHICSLRLRGLYKNKECPHCRVSTPNALDLPLIGAEVD